MAKYFRALGDPTRLRLLGLLQVEGELSAGELTRRQHRVIYYRLADPRVAAMLALADGLLDDNADHVAACCRIPDA